MMIHARQYNESRKDLWIVFNMRRCLIPLPLTVALLLLACAANAETPEVTALKLNNAGVQALNKKHYQEAIDNLSGALKLYPSYQLARQNLSIAYNDYGKSLKNKNNLEALKQLHQAEYWNVEMDPVGADNINKMIRILGKNPDNFADRVELGDYAQAHNDLAGADVEYRAALRLKNDPPTRQKLRDVRSKLKPLE